MTYEEYRVAFDAIEAPEGLSKAEIWDFYDIEMKKLEDQLDEEGKKMLEEGMQYMRDRS